MDYNDNHMDDGLNITNKAQTKNKVADEIIDAIKPSINEIGIVPALKNLLKDCKGDTVYEKIRFYIRNDGKYEDLKSAIDTQIYFLKLVNSNVNLEGVQPIDTPPQTKKVSKHVLRNAMLALIVTVSLVFGIAKGVMYVNRNAHFDEALRTTEESYIVHTLNNYDEGLESIVVSDLGDVDLNDFASFLSEHDFTRDEIICIIDKVLGRSYTDEYCRSLGFKDYYDFLDQYYFDAVYSEGGSILQRFGSERRHVNNVEESIKRKAGFLKILIEEYKTSIGRAR